MGATMTYGLVLACFLCATGWLLESAARSVRWPQRGIWAAMVLLSTAAVGWSFLAVGRATPVTPSTSITSTAPVIAAERSMPRLPAPPAPPLSLDPILGGTWLGLSLLVALGLARSVRRLAAERRSWDRLELEQGVVRVSIDTGPAAVGVFRPEIVVPRWFMDLPAAEQAVLIRHEAEHVRARDAWLLLGGLVALVLVPWNLAVWWQVGRLRGAIEIDCDRRVLRHDADLRRYARLLLDTSRRHGPMRLGVAAFAHPSSLLERRIRIMTDLRTPRRFRAILAVALGTIVLATACRMDRPTEPNLADAIVTEQAESGPESPFIVSARAEKGVITGTVTDRASGRPLASVRVLLPEHEMGSLTNIQGRFIMLQVPAGEQKLVLEHPDVAGQVELRIVVAPGPSVAPAPIADAGGARPDAPTAAPVRPLPPWAGMSPDELGTVSGRVLDADGEPLGSVGVSIPELEVGGLTRPDGRFVLVQLPPGEYRIEVRLPDGSMVAIPDPVEVVAGEAREAVLSVRRDP